jgi:hypothetical protein
MATVRFHGGTKDVPVSFRDPKPVTAAEVKLKCDQIAAQKDELDSRLSPLLGKIQAGTATPQETALVPDLAEDSRILTGRLKRARTELMIAEDTEASATARGRRERFDTLQRTTRKQRAEFCRLVRAACITLGQLCEGVDEATKIANSFIGVGGMNPLDKNALTEMSEHPNPLPEMLDSGFSPTTGFGWDISIPVVPLKKG